MILITGGILVGYIFYKQFMKKLTKQKEEDEELAPLRSPENDKFLELKNLLSEPVSEGWDVIKKTSTLEVYKKITESSPIAIIKAKIFIPETTIEDVLFAIWDGNFRRKWDNVIQDFQVLETLSEESDIIYFYAASPMPSLVSNREFLQYRRFSKEKNAIYIVYWSADKDNIPVPKDWIRAHTIISGYSIRAEDGGAVVEFISQNDVKGKIPHKLINTLAPSKAMDWVKKLGKACATLRENRKNDSIN